MIRNITGLPLWLVLGALAASLYEEYTSPSVGMWVIASWVLAAVTCCAVANVTISITRERS